MKLKFATQVESEILTDVRQIADSEGRQLQSVIEEALMDLIEKKRQTKPRPHVMAHLEASMSQFDAVYKELAK